MRAQGDDDTAAEDEVAATPFAQIQAEPAEPDSLAEDDVRVEEDVDGFEPPVQERAFPKVELASRVPPSRSSAFTIPLLCAGVAILACCLIIPAADENRQLVYERESLKADLAQIEKQVGVNDAFLKKLASDPGLSERLAQRQMKMVREGTSVLELKGPKAASDMSPFLLVSVPPPAPMPPYRPVGGVLAGFCRNPKTQLYLTGAALLMMAVGLVLGSSSPSRE